MAGVLNRTSNSVRVLITECENTNWHEITVGGSVIFKWKLGEREHRLYGMKNYYVDFSKRNPLDKLNYIITYTHWEVLDEINTAVMRVSTDRVGTPCCLICRCSPQKKVTVEISIDQISSFATIYDDAELTDFMLRGEDGSVPFHKLVIAAHSSVFKTMLTGEWKETSEGVIDVPGTSKETLQHLKMYMYLGKLPEIQNERLKCITQLFLLSSCYLIEDLKQRCLKEFRFLLTAENVKSMMQFTMKNNYKQFFVQILDCVAMGDIDLDAVRNHIEGKDIALLHVDDIDS